jgi:sugar phosphate isomerase/epimerase
MRDVTDRIQHVTQKGRADSNATRRWELSLASRTLPEAAPAEMVSAAASAGFDAAGLWVVPGQWDASTTRNVRERLADTGLRVLDVEVMILGPDVPDADLERIVEVGVELNARYGLAIGTDPDLARTADRFGRLCERAAAGGLRLGLEFMRFTEVRTLADAVGVVRAAGHPAGGVLIDMLHLIRSGGRPEDLVGIDPDLLAYAQLCDAPAAAPGEALGQLVDEALVGRTLPGDGGLPVAEILARLPEGRPLSCEIMSSALQERHPDPAVRAKVVADAIRAFLARVES